MKKFYNHISSKGKRYPVFLKIILILIVLAVIFMLGACRLSSAAQIDSPQITKQSGQRVLLLPDSLHESIRINFHGYSIPAETDMIGRWLEEKNLNSFPYISWGDFNGDGLIDIAVILVRKEQEKHVKQERREKQDRHNKQWIFVIFHQKQERGYKPVYELSEKQCELFVFNQNHGKRYKKDSYAEERSVNKPNMKILSPQQVVLGTIKQGTGWAPEAGDVPVEFKHDFDVVLFSAYVKKNNFTQVYQSLFYWGKNKYHIYEP